MIKLEEFPMKNKKNAFTMIELVFVIVILGILAAVAIPKLAATRTDATIAKGRADIASIRSSIVMERQARLVRGDPSWIPKLSNSTTTLFTGSDVNRTLLMYGIASGDWTTTVANAGLVHTFTVNGTAVTFTYSNTIGIFTCDTTAGTTAQQELCASLIN